MVLQNLSRYATVYEASPYEVAVFIPATAKIIKRDLAGSWHTHNNASEFNYLGAYIYNTKTGFPASKTGTFLTESINLGEIKTVGFGQDTSLFPDSEGFLVFDWGSDNQEGPVRYLGRPSSGSLLLDPAYKFQQSHSIGADVRLLSSRKPYIPKVDGSDYPTYVTGTIQGRIEAEKLLIKLKAAGIFMTVIVVYPEGPGLNNIQDVYA
jgi:hypothetical protein